MSKSVKKRSAVTYAAGGEAKAPQQGTVDPRGKKAEPGSKQSRVIAMLQSPAGDDCRHDAGDRLAAALGAWLPGRRGAQAPQAQAWLEEGGWDPGVPGCNRRQRQARRSPLQAPAVLIAPCRASGSALPCRTRNHSTPRLRACAISASASFAAVGTPCSGGSRPLTC